METHSAELLYNLGLLLLGGITRLRAWRWCSIVFLAFRLRRICTRRRILDLDDELTTQLVRAWKSIWFALRFRHKKSLPDFFHDAYHGELLIRIAVDLQGDDDGQFA